jgi:hypothetical protein
VNATTAQFLTLGVGCLALISNLVWIVVVLRVKVEILTKLDGFRREMRGEYVLKEVYDCEHPHVTAQMAARHAR